MEKLNKIYFCGKCGSKDFVYLGNNKCNCRNCKCETSLEYRYTDSHSKRTESPFKRNESRVYATGNRWAIENWNATHY